MNKDELTYIVDLMYNRKMQDINDIEQQMITKILKKIKEMLKDGRN